MRAPLFVGIDVSQNQLDVAVRPGTAFQVTHDDTGMAEVVDKLQAVQPALIVLEATGGLEVPLWVTWKPDMARKVRVHPYTYKIPKETPLNSKAHHWSRPSSQNSCL